MTMAIDARTGNTAATGKDLGWLTWWTIHQADRTVQDVQQAATAANIPQWMIDRIAGRSDRSAWLAATQLGAKGVEADAVTGDPADAKVRFLTRDIKANETRALVREVTDSSGERVSSDTVAQIYFNATSGMVAQVAPNLDPALETQVNATLSSMKSQLSAISGKIDDGRIRALVIDWLERQHRVTVRGTGGVYLVPRPRDDAEATRIESELLTLRAWLTSMGNGLFSIVQVSDRGATTVDAFVSAAVDELKVEIESVNGNIEKWSKNPNMNDGSRMFSADAMMTRLDGLQERMRVLIESLGEEVGVVESMLSQVLRKAQVMRDDAVGTINAGKTQRTEQTQAQRAEKLAALKAAREAKLDATRAEREAAKQVRDEERAKAKAEEAVAKQAKADERAAAKASAKVTPPATIAPAVQDASGVVIPEKLRKMTKQATSNGTNGDSDIPMDSGDLSVIPAPKKSRKQGVTSKATVKL